MLTLGLSQISALQEINKKLQEYNASLQVYNAKMQSDAAMAAETISKIQKEKSSMMETLSSLRGHSVSLQEQLNQAKVKNALKVEFLLRVEPYLASRDDKMRFLRHPCKKEQIRESFSWMSKRSSE